jgi:hypothetical protein
MKWLVASAILAGARFVIWFLTPSYRVWRRYRKEQH